MREDETGVWLNKQAIFLLAFIIGILAIGDDSG